MDFINKEDYLSIGVRHLLNDAFQPLFKFSLKFGARYKPGYIQHKYFLTAQVLRHIPFDNTPGDAFYNGGFSYPSFTHEYGIIFLPTRQYMQHPAYFFIPANNRIQFAVLRSFIEVYRKFEQCLIVAL